MDDPRLIPFEVDEAARAARSPDQLPALVGGRTMRLGITGVLAADIPLASESNDPHVLLHGWDRTWTARYLTNRYIRDDPAVKPSATRQTPYVWSEERARRSLSRIERQIAREAREAGIVDGFTVPIHGPFLRRSCVSFSTTGRTLTETERHILGMVAHVMLSHVDRLSPPTPRHRGESHPLPRLAPRELQCLHWVAHGKTSWEIGQILKLSQRTVDQYIKTAEYKLRASNRTEAIAAGVYYGLISPPVRG